MTRSKRKKPLPFFLWHRRLGLAALVVVFILSITGIMLNHTESLKLDETAIESDFLLNWYGINPQGTPINFNIGNINVSQWQQQIFFNSKPLLTHQDKLQGIVQINNIIAIALQKHILLVDETGEIIELMPLTTASPILKIGLSNNKIALIDSQSHIYLSDTQITQWKQYHVEVPQWSTPTKLTDTQIHNLKLAYRGQGLNLERIILDLHSGRIFNSSWGIYVMDAAAVLMMFLGISGVWVWWSRKLKIRRKKHYQKHH